MIHIGGFTPWLTNTLWFWKSERFSFRAFKYITNEHGGVATEWQTVEITSAYNAYLDADACCVQVSCQQMLSHCVHHVLQAMANAAFYQHFPLQPKYLSFSQLQWHFNRYQQNPAPTYDELVQKGYIDSNGKVVTQTYVHFMILLSYLWTKMQIMFYVGDYDSAAWLYSEFKGNWDDSDRGSVPLGWFSAIALIELLWMTKNLAGQLTRIWRIDFQWFSITSSNHCNQMTD